MEIIINFDSGTMRLNGENFIQMVPMENYRKWVKFFAQYAETDTKTGFLNFITGRICREKISMDYHKTRVEMAENILNDTASPLEESDLQWCRQRLKEYRTDIRRCERNIKRWETMKSLLKELVT